MPGGSGGPQSSSQPWMGNRKWRGGLQRPCPKLWAGTWVGSSGLMTLGPPVPEGWDSRGPGPLPPACSALGVDGQGWLRAEREQRGWAWPRHRDLDEPKAGWAGPGGAGDGARPGSAPSLLRQARTLPERTFWSRWAGWVGWPGTVMHRRAAAQPHPNRLPQHSAPRPSSNPKFQFCPLDAGIPGTCLSACPRPPVGASSSRWDLMALGLRCQGLPRAVAGKTRAGVGPALPRLAVWPGASR